MDFALQIFHDGSDKILTHLARQLGAIRAGGASPQLVEHVQAEVYGAMQPIRNLGNISVPDAHSLLIEIWDRDAVSAVEKALHLAELGASPRIEGNKIYLNIPPTTAEDRERLVKKVHVEGEEARIAVRKVRESAKKAIEATEGSEDEVRAAEKSLQDAVDAVNGKIEAAVKEREAMVRKV